MIIRRPCDFLRKGFIRQNDESNFKPESLSIIYHIAGFGTIKNTIRKIKTGVNDWIKLDIRVYYNIINNSIAIILDAVNDFSD